MKQRLVHIIGALAILLSIAGTGYATGVNLAGTVDVIAPQSASATCVIGYTRPLYSGSAFYGKEHANGCGSVYLQVCLQPAGGGTYACRSFSGSGAAVTLWTGAGSTAYGCSQRTWAWSNLYGTQVSAYSYVC